MQRLNKTRFVEEFRLRPFGAKGWLSSKFLTCPHCGKSDKFGVSFTEDGGKGCYHCFKCDKKGSIFSLLRAINRPDLIIKDGDEGEYQLDDKLSVGLNIMAEKEDDLACPECSMPLGFRPLTESEYLKGRGWEPWQLKAYHAGTSIDPKLKNKITFLLYEDGKVIGYLSRSLLSKEWHKQNLADFKAGKASLVLRYDNSHETPFERVVGGIDEITEETDTVIIVEGIMDKAGTDRTLGLNESPYVKCCFTCGCKLSEAQMLKIYRKGVKNIILCYDPDTIQQVKSASMKLSRKFNIKIAELHGEKDPAEMNFCEFEKVFANLLSPIEFYANRLQIGKLK